MYTQTLSPKHILWKRAVLSSSIVTIVAMAALFGARSLSAHGAGNAVAAFSSEKDPAIESLSKKIAAENEEHQAFQSKRAGLASSLQQLPAFVMTPTERTHHELVNQLVHLLALEKQSPEDSPEITSTREQIDKLQSQIAEMPPTNGHIQAVSSPARATLETQLADADHQISLNEAQTKADVSQLGHLVRAREVTTSRHYSSNDSATSTVVLASILVGLITGFVLVILARLYSIRDEAVLRDLLPSTVKLIGTIPHMRART